MTATHADPNRWKALALVSGAGFLSVLDFFIVNVAVPSIQGGLAAGLAEIQLVMAAYSLFFASALVIGGRAGDRYGHRAVFICGTWAFTATSAFCGLATSPIALIAFRALQGLAAAFMIPQALSIIHTSFHDDERRRAFGYYATATGLASVGGQLIGGVLLRQDPLGLGWRSIFLVCCPFGAAIAAAAPGWLRETHARTGLRLDIAGAALLSAALLLFELPLIVGRKEGWPLWSWLVLGVSLLLFAAFLARQRRLAAGSAARLPVVDLRLFRDPDFTMGSSVSFLINASQSALFLILTLFLQQALGFDPFASGAVFTSIGAGFFAFSFLASRVRGALGPRAVVGGLAVIVAGLALLYRELAAANQPGFAQAIVPALVLCGGGQGFVFPILLAMILGRAPRESSGSASGVLQTVQQIAMSLGAALSGFALVDGRFGAPLPVWVSLFRRALLADAAVLALAAVLAAGLAWRSRRAVEAAVTPF